MIPYLDLKAQYKGIKEEVDAAVMRTISSVQFALGAEVEAFEGSFASYCGTRHSVAVNSGTSALHLALLAANVGPGDEVITTPMTFVATASAIRQTGATPVFVDIDPETWNIDATQVAAAVTDRTKALMPVHLHGLICEMVPLMEIAESRGLTVIEDAAQAHGAKYKGRRSGSIGHIGCFSFYPSKNLGAYGEGGAIVTNDDEYAEKVRKMRDWGQGEKYCHVMQGFNCRMDGIQGSVLNVKLKYIDEWNEARRRVAANYDALFSGHVIAVPKSIESSRHVYHVYALRLTDRNAVRERLTDNGVATGIHYPLPLHLQPIFSDLGHKAGDFPVAEQIASETLSLPIYPELVQENIEKIAKILIAAPVKNKGWNKVPQEHT